MSVIRSIYFKSEQFLEQLKKEAEKENRTLNNYIISVLKNNLENKNGKSAKDI